MFNSLESSLIHRDSLTTAFKSFNGPSESLKLKRIVCIVSKTTLKSLKSRQTVVEYT